MRVQLHISERICELCQVEYSLQLGCWANNDSNPLLKGGECRICGNYTIACVGSIIITNEPIETIEKAETKFEAVRQLHNKRIKELLLKIRKAKQAGESHINIQN